MSFVCVSFITYPTISVIVLMAFGSIPHPTIVVIARGQHMSYWHNFSCPYLNAERFKSLAQILFVSRVPLSHTFTTHYITSFSCKNIISNYVYTCGYHFLISCGINILILCAFSFSVQ